MCPLVAEEEHEDERQYDALDKTENKNGLRRELHMDASIIPKACADVQRIMPQSKGNMLS